MATETPTPTPTVTETPTETTTTTTFPKPNYIEFNSYEITLPSKVRLVGSIRIYTGVRFADIGGVGSNIGGVGSTYFPFVSTVLVRTGRERITYYRLMNSNGQVVFTTDEEGISTLFDNNSNELAQQS
jgi:hypothetical protein